MGSPTLVGEPIRRALARITERGHRRQLRPLRNARHRTDLANELRHLPPMHGPVLQEIDYLHDEIERLASSVARGEAERRDMALQKSIIDHYRLTLRELLEASNPAPAVNNDRQHAPR
jgi:HAMP domain-containing protein